MPAEKRKCVDPFEGSHSRPVVIDEGQHEACSGEDEILRSKKKRRNVQQSSRPSHQFSTLTTVFNYPPSSMCLGFLESPKGHLPQPTPASSIIGSESEEPWGVDRHRLRQGTLALWEEYRNSGDGSIDSALTNLTSIATEMEGHPGRSPAYRMAQMKKVGNCPLLKLPGEVRNVIWEYANPGKARCCFAGAKTHDDPDKPEPTNKDAECSLIRALVGRGIPLNRQILWESRGVATPVGLRFCTWFCALLFVIQICTSHERPLYPGMWEKGRPWRDIKKLEVDMQADMNEQGQSFGPEVARSRVIASNDIHLLQRLRESHIPDKWASYTTGNTYVLEKMPKETAEEAACPEH